MDDRSLKRLKAELEEELSRLDAQVAELQESNQSLQSEASGENAYRDHMADQGLATFERELDMTLEENLRDRRAEVLGALKRIEDGEYGKCERCGAKIPTERMEAVPTASLCIACKSADEHR
jgi:DnaK suppressor protein